jgi:pimeloyl-ACP methyl ester carboxylesterase
MSKDKPRLIEHRAEKQNQAAIVFVHGFGGDVDATWGQFPDLLKQSKAMKRWDIHSLGYPTKLRLDLLASIWSADPDLPMLAMSLHTSCITPPLDRYKSLALIAHSMGGLVVQRALADHDDLLDRVTHVLLFGTPSGGLEKASLFQRLKRQIRDMSPVSPFLTDLRAKWKEKFGKGADKASSFEFWSIAGEEDEFVPGKSSLGPFQTADFPDANLAVIPGNHLQIVKPRDSSSKGVVIVLKVILGKAAPAGPWNSAAVALESSDFRRVVKELQPHQSELDEAALVQLALALEGLGRKAEAIRVLEGDASDSNKNRLDAMGVLGGRLKRRWLVERRQADAEHARKLYADAFTLAEKSGRHDDAFYPGINVAFMDLAFRQDRQAAETMAKQVLGHCQSAKEGMWRFATEGEANLILGRIPEALAQYCRAVEEKPAPRQMESMYLQAMKVADLVGSRKAAQELAAIFRPEDA